MAERRPCRVADLVPETYLMFGGRLLRVVSTDNFNAEAVWCEDVGDRPDDLPPEAVKRDELLRKARVIEPADPDSVARVR